MQIKSFILSIIFCIGITYAQDFINDTEAVHNFLKQEKNKTIQSLKTNTKHQYEHLNHLLDLGEWDFVVDAIKDSKALSNVERALLKFKISWLNNDFQAAENILNGLKAKERENLKVQASFALLEIEAWELEKAENLSRELLAKNPKDIEISLILGRSLMLQKKYADALALANNLIQEHPKNASGYFFKS
jgi:predicted Zn-dependent protease